MILSLELPLFGVLFTMESVLYRGGTDCRDEPDCKKMNKYITVFYGLLTKREVKTAGYWPCSFCVFTDRDKVEVHKHAKMEQGQYPAILTKQAWLIKDLLYGKRALFSCWTRRVIQSGQDSSILPARVANHSAGFGSSCPLRELAM